MLRFCLQQTLIDDWFLKRFLIARRFNLDNAFKMLADTLKWRKRENFRHLEDNAFPSIFYAVGAVFTYEPNLEGQVTIYIRVKYVLKLGEFNTYLKKYATKIFFDLDRDYSSPGSKNGVCVVVDFNETGLQNAEFDFIKHAVQITSHYLPFFLRKIIVVDLPWILKFGYHVIKSWIPEAGRNLLIFTNRKNLTDYIAKEKLPYFLEGTCPRPYKGIEMVPKETISLFEFCQKNKIDHKKALCIIELYRPILEAEGVYYKDIIL